MRSGECPKCNSRNVYFKHQGVIYVTGQGKLSLDTGGWTADSSELDGYVCTRCGYFETYITDTPVLGKITEKWDKIE